MLCRLQALVQQLPRSSEIKTSAYGKTGMGSQFLCGDDLVLRYIQLVSYPPRCLAAGPWLQPQKLPPHGFQEQLGMCRPEGPLTFEPLWFMCR